MAERVVDGLEVVEVDGDRGDVRCPRSDPFEEVVQEPAVVGPGQVVGVGQALRVLQRCGVLEVALPFAQQLVTQQLFGHRGIPAGGGIRCGEQSSGEVDSEPRVALGFEREVGGVLEQCDDAQGCTDPRGPFRECLDRAAHSQQRSLGRTAMAVAA